jgi:multidrug efflux system membrane fusion protein
MRVARPGEKEVAVPIPENRVAEVRGAQSLEVTLWSAPGRRWSGKLRELAPAADPVTRTYLAKVTVLEPGPDVALGMTATVTVKGEGAPVVRLPSTALYQQGDKAAVWLVDTKTNTVKLKPVTVERFHDAYVGIADGLAAGDTVVRAGVHKLSPDLPVRVLPEVAQ